MDGDGSSFNMMFFCVLLSSSLSFFIKNITGRLYNIVNSRYENYVTKEWL